MTLLPLVSLGFRVRSAWNCSIDCVHHNFGQIFDGDFVAFVLVAAFLLVIAHNFGVALRGLYGGMTIEDVRKLRDCARDESPLDRMGRATDAGAARYLDSLHFWR